MKVLLSIKPEYADKIFDRSKKFEFRKSMFRHADVRTIVVYATKPVGRIVGEFEVEGVLCESPERLWTLTQTSAGISKQFFDEYFSGRSKAFAIKVGQIHKFSEPLNPSDLIENFTPPQSFMYVDDSFERPQVSQMVLAL
ncbi:ASCH domain-containing protein [Ancylobacter sp. SL191]|uniref:ASCH domain-containing protein n=1 Tax=Ancylobacter sp. SL191 TaxID=2995166 RepID=UPI002271BFCC|nr:ASCH domain-containing protein [Ancylobacter sp. SL191]WAC28246.1 ASCH domain-containing protein [Ancylobacter sp. SL191]